MDDALTIPGMSPPTCSFRGLERLRAGELDAAESERIRAHAAGCPRCGARLAELEREAAELRREVSFERFEARVLAKDEKLRRDRRRSAWMRPAGLALAAGIAAAAIGGPLAYQALGGGPNRLKGSDGTLELFVGGTGAAPRKAVDGEKLRPGERVRAGYQTREHKYFLIFSVDEAGVATPLYPESGSSLPAEKGQGTHLLGDALELTGAGRERLVALFSDQPLQVQAVLEAASQEFARAGGLDGMRPLPLRARESSVTLRKPGEPR